MGFDCMWLNFMNIDVMGMDFAVSEATAWDWGFALFVFTLPVHLLILFFGCAVIWSKPKGQRSGCATTFFGLPLAAAACLLLIYVAEKVEVSRRQAEFSAQAAAEREAYLAAKQAAVPHRMNDGERLNELCEQAGRFIHRKASEVEGVFLMRLRPTRDEAMKDLQAQDPYGHWQWHYRSGMPKIPPGIASGQYIWAFARAYSYVDAIDPKDGKRYRYTAFRYIPAEERSKNSPEKRDSIERHEVTPDMPLPRYGVTWADITEREDRERYWIAGSSLKVIDLENGETMGERIGYMMMPWRKGAGNDPEWWRSNYSWCTNKLTAGVSPGAIPTIFVGDVLEPKKFEIPLKDDDPFAEK